MEVNYKVYVIGTGTACPAVDVYDTFFTDPLETGLTAGETLRKYEYKRTIGPYETCGEYTITNTASLSSVVPQVAPVVLTTTPPPCEFDVCYSWTIPVHVPCDGGCTLTQGYWKTHSGNRLKGGPPYDETWDQIGASRANTPFYGSGMTYYDVLREPPKGNAYYILARQFIAAKLNTLKGASTTPEVEAAIASANTFFMTYGPGAIVSKAVRNQALIDASILDGYNNGYVGPGHCSEEGIPECSAR